MKYSFVLPAYKARFLKEAIDSILSQTHEDFELIIVNDASPEDLDSIVKEYKDERIQYYVNDINLGGKDLVAQWNHSVAYAKGEYLILASDDDLYDPRYLEEMDKLIKRFPESDVFRPRIQYINNESEVIDIAGCPREYCSGIEYLLFLIRGWIGSGVPFYVFRRSALDNIGGFADYPSAWFSDDATALRLSSNGIISSKEVLFSFRTSGINISSRLNSRNDLINKFSATEMYYSEFSLYIDSYVALNDYERCVKECLKAEFAVCLHNRARTQLFHSKLLTATQLLPMALKLPFGSSGRLLLFYIVNLIKKCLRIG